MKKIIGLTAALLITLLVVLSIGVSAASYSSYTAPYATTAPTIDGTIASGEWDAAEWASIAYYEGDKEVKGSAKFKVMHDDQYIYMLFEVIDSEFNEWDAIGLGFSDVRGEDGGEHVKPNNSMSFRHNTMNNTVSIGNDLQREGATRLTEEKETVLAQTSDGYVIETKLEYAGGIPASVYFQVAWTEANVDTQTLWNEHWSSKLFWQTTKCYGELIFVPKSANYSSYTAPFVTTAPSIDGTISLDEWDAAEWANIANEIEGRIVNGSAKFKVMHDDTYVYILFDVVDPTLSDWDNVGVHFSDIRGEAVEGAAKVGPNNTISVRHLAANSFSDASNDRGKNGDFSAPLREGDSLVTVVAQAGADTANGYVVELKLEYNGGVPASVYFNASFGEANEGKDMFWNEYWGWNLMGLSTECYGNLNFAAEQVDSGNDDNTGDNTGDNTDDNTGDNTGDNTDDNTGANPGTFDIVLMVVAVATLSGMGVAASKKTRR